MTTRIETRSKEETRIAIPNITVADIEAILGYLPQEDSRLRRELETSIVADAVYGYYTFEKLTAFVMEDLFTVVENMDYTDEEIVLLMRAANPSKLADALCGDGAWLDILEAALDTDVLPEEEEDE